MTPETEKLIYNSAIRDYTDGKNKVDILKCDFSISYNKIIVNKILFMSINGVDIYDLDKENIVSDGLELTFNDMLPHIDESYTPDQVEWNEDNQELRLTFSGNSMTYYLVDSNLGYFVSDFSANVKPTLKSLMNTFCNWCAH